MKKILIGIIAVLLLAGAAGAGLYFWFSADDQEEGYRLYYLSQEEDCLIPYYENAEEAEPYALVAELYHLQQKLPEKSEVKLLVPEEVELRNYNLEDKLLSLNFNNAYNSMSVEREILVRAGLVRLFTQIPDIKKVQFFVEGEPLRNAEGLDVGQMTAGRFVENSGKEINSYLKTTMVLYFSDTTGTKLLPEERNVYYNSNVPLERVVVEQLVKGPADQKHKATLPTELNILSVTIQDEICYVNLDDSFTTLISISNGALIPELAVYSIVNSISGICGVNKIQFSINGRTNVKIGSVDMSHLFTANPELIREEQVEEEPAKEQEYTAESKVN